MSNLQALKEELNRQYKQNYEIAIVELHKDGLLITFPELGGLFYVETWEQWEKETALTALPGDKHPDAAPYVEQAKHQTFTTGPTAFCFLLPWTNS